MRTTGTEPRTRSTQEKLLEFLSESGNVSFACKRAGISRETYYRWRADSIDFASDASEAMEYGKSFVNDLAHSQLIRNIQEGSMQAVRFQLVSCHPDYQPKRPKGPEGGRGPVVEINLRQAAPITYDANTLIVEQKLDAEPSPPASNAKETIPVTTIHVSARPQNKPVSDEERSAPINPPPDPDVPPAAPLG